MVHGSALNTSDRSRRILFFEMMAADAFPIMGSMTKWDGIEDYNTRMLCWHPDTHAAPEGHSDPHPATAAGRADFDL